jgi:hypothetical protein
LAVASFPVDKTQQYVNTVVGDSPAVGALLHELQLGEQLNESLSQTRRADFSLMLAMLAQDVREQSQFVLPPNTEIEAVSQDNIKLRAFFELPEKAPLALKNNEHITFFNQAEMLNENGLENLHLSNAMRPRPLAFRDDDKHIQSNVMSNTSLYCQIKHRQCKQEESLNSKVLNKPLSFNAKSWLKGIEETLIKAPLLA